MFENLIGNEEIKKLLNNVTEPTHAYMFSGPEGIGKFLFAKEFANKFLCISDNKPCGECKSCLQFKNANNTDFQIIDSEENTIKIEKIREMISKIYEKPILADKKIYIINNADKMTTQAQNCLLKILEEPPKYVIIILIVSNENVILNTVKSRCVKIQFNKIENNKLIQYLGDKVSNEMLEIYNGSIGRAIELKDKEEKYANIQKIVDYTSVLEYMKIAKTIYEDKEEIKNYLEYMNMLFYKKTNEDIRYVNCINKINNSISKLKYNCNIEMLIDELLLEIWEELNEKHCRSKV